MFMEDQLNGQALVEDMVFDVEKSQEEKKNLEQCLVIDSDSGNKTLNSPMMGDSDKKSIVVDNTQLMRRFENAWLGEEGLEN